MPLTTRLPALSREATFVLAGALRQGTDPHAERNPLPLDATVSTLSRPRTGNTTSFVITPNGQRTGAERRFEVTVRELIPQ